MVRCCQVKAINNGLLVHITAGYVMWWTGTRLLRKIIHAQYEFIKFVPNGPINNNSALFLNNNNSALV